MKDLLLRLQRRRLQKKLADNALARFVAQTYDNGAKRLVDAELVCLDIETTGLDPANAELLSIGWVVIRSGRIDLSTAETRIVRPTGTVGDSAAIHGLTDTTVAAGEPLSQVLERTLQVLGGRVLVVHFAGLDKSLLDRLCRAEYGGPLPIPVIDTMELEIKRRRRQHHVPKHASLRLADLRSEYKLPRYKAHDCLVDAIATAELLLAIVATRRDSDRCRLRELYA